jgi:hypothetical protein
MGTARIETCLTCDTPFTPVPRHPMVETAWCPACLAVLQEVWLLEHVWTYECWIVEQAEEV